MPDRLPDVGQEVPFGVTCKGNSVGTCYADVIVENRVIVELRVAEAICLRASGMPVGLLFNFGGPSLTMRRVLP